MKPIERVAIVGLGLIGGSLARALAARDVRVLGYDSQPESLDAAEGEGIVQQRMGAQLDGIDTADVVVIAIPVDATLSAIVRMAPKLDGVRLVMDVASTKRSIVAAAEAAGLGPQFVGAHPLTGRGPRCSMTRGSFSAPRRRRRPMRCSSPKRSGEGCALEWKCSMERRTTSRWRGAAISPMCCRPHSRARYSKPAFSVQRSDLAGAT
jgi:prephenate dehydrogenase